MSIRLPFICVRQFRRQSLVIFFVEILALRLFGSSSGQNIAQERKYREYLIISVGAADAGWERNWIEAHKPHGIHFRPLLLEPDPRRMDVLSDFALEFGGRYFQNAAGTRWGDRLPMYGVGSSCGTILENPFCRPNMSQTSWVETVDLAALVNEELEASGGDAYVVMHMDVEGAEYELLRDLVVRGVACRLKQIFVETHAMFFRSLQHLRPVDVVLPWLLGSPACGVEVVVDNHYFIERHIWRQESAEWPENDGGCSTCPLLYRPLPPSMSSKPSCPDSFMPMCFDEIYTCERCCDLRKGLQGDQECWTRQVDWGKMSYLNSYDFCCALMVPLDFVRNPQAFLVNSVSLEAQVRWREKARLLPPLE